MMKAFEGYCSGCTKKRTCTELCPVAEEYVNQDYVPKAHDEDPCDQIGMDTTMVDYNWFNSIASSVHLTRRERQILRLLGLGLSRQDICYLLEISPHNLEQLIHLLKKKAKDI